MSEKEINIIRILSIVVTLIFIFLSLFVIFKVTDEISNEIVDNGGLGKSIGKFINNIKSEIK